ncbi:hypothetical protein Fcan01_12061 [Folsomia candida]|uniref:Uncharacterized protein n=1 Tax=Folsomia candida TaxID=158441 RepID=A0A226E7I1_FOLCA|nr:hypothetical protein Fcan01_12061 [Folsomia candida]
MLIFTIPHFSVSRIVFWPNAYLTALQEGISTLRVVGASAESHSPVQLAWKSHAKIADGTVFAMRVASVNAKLAFQETNATCWPVTSDVRNMDNVKMGRVSVAWDGMGGTAPYGTGSNQRERERMTRQPPLRVPPHQQSLPRRLSLLALFLSLLFEL